jgi:hypothetical protein
MARQRDEEKKLALVLPVDRAPSIEPQVFGGFPGVWTPGVPIAVESLGLTVNDARRLVEERGLPLVVESVEKAALHHVVERVPAAAEPVRPPVDQDTSLLTESGALIAPAATAVLAGTEPHVEQQIAEATVRLAGAASPEDADEAEEEAAGPGGDGNAATGPGTAGDEG